MNVPTFRGSPRPTLGVELEFQLVDPVTMALKGVAPEVLAALPGPSRESVKPEFYLSCVEVNTGVCDDVAAVGRDLRQTLEMLARAATRRGARLAWGGTHPFSHWRDQAVLPTSRYRRLAEFYRETLCRQVTFGLHVHVGVADGDTAVRVCQGLAEHLPALLALSANSPFWCGRDTGHRSYRVEVMSASSISGTPPRMAGWDDYARLLGRFASAGLIESPKDLWWDVRPSPEHGTVEVRICDMPPDLRSVLALTALTQCLVADLAARDDQPAPDECGLLVVRQNRWRAARFGLDAEFVDLRTNRPEPTRAVIRNLAARLSGVAARLGCPGPLADVQAMAAGTGGADRQLAVYRSTCDLESVARHTAGGNADVPAYPAPASFSWTAAHAAR